MNSPQRYISYLRNYSNFFRKFKKFIFFSNKFEKLIKNKKIDLVYFTGPSEYSLYLEDTKFIITVPDVAHRENLEFPEMNNNSEFERREDILAKVLPKAIAIVTNAKIIKQRICFFYKVLSERVSIINHQPSLAVDNFSIFNEDHSSRIKKKFSLPDKYLFYPAMYFPHKNHKTLIDSIEKLKNENKKINLVCCGNDVGYLHSIKKYAKLKNIEDQIIFLDYIDDEDLPYLYLNSSMLVMTSLIGPTNIPPWEAFKLNIPVIYPNLEGIKEIYNDCVSYYEPLDSTDLANKINQLFNDTELRNKLIKNGKNKIIEVVKKNEFFQVINQIKKFFEKQDL
jgi:glycosyltransferase involved in cell wall biosynthesis